MEQDPNGEVRVNRINYEIRALHSLREGLRCIAIWVVGADRFRNPDEDVPADFEEQRTRYYAVLQQPESNVQHPTYRALIELGEAIETSFLARYLHEESLRREINEGLNVVESWNSANGFIFYGKSGEIATNRPDDQELFSALPASAAIVFDVH